MGPLWISVVTQPSAGTLCRGIWGGGMGLYVDINGCLWISLVSWPSLCVPRISITRATTLKFRQPWMIWDYPRHHCISTRAAFIT